MNNDEFEEEGYTMKEFLKTCYEVCQQKGRDYRDPYLDGAIANYSGSTILNPYKSEIMEATFASDTMDTCFNHCMSQWKKRVVVQQPVEIIGHPTILHYCKVHLNKAVEKQAREKKVQHPATLVGLISVVRCQDSVHTVLGSMLLISLICRVQTITVPSLDLVNIVWIFHH